MEYNTLFLSFPFLFLPSFYFLSFFFLFLFLFPGVGEVFVPMFCINAMFQLMKNQFLNKKEQNLFPQTTAQILSPLMLNTKFPNILFLYFNHYRRCHHPKPSFMNLLRICIFAKIRFNMHIAVHLGRVQMSNSTCAESNPGNVWEKRIYLL